MKYSYNSEQNRWEMLLKGDVDVFAAPELRRCLYDMASQRTADIYIDAAELSYIDSTGIGALVAGLNAIRGEGHKCTVKGLSAHIKRLFVITGLESVFTLED